MGLCRSPQLVATHSAPAWVHIYFFTLLIKKIGYHQSSSGGRRALSEGDTYRRENIIHSTLSVTQRLTSPGQDICNVFGFRTIDEIKAHTLTQYTCIMYVCMYVYVCANKVYTIRHRVSYSEIYCFNFMPLNSSEIRYSAFYTYIYY